VNHPTLRTVVVRPLEPRDREWAEHVLASSWHSKLVVTRTGLHDASRLPGLVAEHDHDRVGLLTYHLADGAEGTDCEVITLNALVGGRGIGTALLDALASVARSNQCRRLWLTTTNDNTAALRFYQRRGWDLFALHRDVIAQWRTLKPEMSARGNDGIPIAHALELQLLL
jgi:ribosomal protein S18 acetylase RimI-like enzyme